VILHLAILELYRLVTDGWKDKQVDRHMTTIYTVLAQHHAVKKTNQFAGCRKSLIFCRSSMQSRCGNMVFACCMK